MTKKKAAPPKVAPGVKARAVAPVMTEAQAAAHASLQVRIDECERTLKTGKTGDPARPHFARGALEAIIACHRRLQRGLGDALMA